ncbi:hypothetical protein Tco_0187268 [Tanacetum coccineum]
MVCVIEHIPLNNNWFTIIKTILLKTLNIPPPDRNSLPETEDKAIVTSSAPTYDPEPATVTEDEEMSKGKEIDKLMALISLSFKKIYKPTNNNLLNFIKHQSELIKIILQESTEKLGMIIRGQLMLLGLRKM